MGRLDAVVPRSAVETAVFVSGVSSLGLEILAGRIVAPAYGNSIYVWGSIIGVFLAALSLGYWVGGRTADRASRSTLVTILALSSVLAALVVVAGEAIVEASAGLPVPSRYATVPAIVALFGPLTVLVGFVSPYGAELSAAEGRGAASGRVYALGTVGSIIGTFGTTFVLIPVFDVTTIAVLYGGLLLVSALVVADPTPRAAAKLGVAALVLLSGTVVGVYGVQAGENTLHQTQTEYSELRVAEEDGVRTLYLDGVPHSATYTDGREGYVFEYSQYAHVPMLFQEDVDRVLFIGGGGFSGPKRFAEEYDVHVDVVEIDPAVVSAAKNYFDVREGPQFDIHTMDGRRFLEQTDETYDLVVLDAYQRSSVPFHLTTVEFMELVSSRLDADGVVVANTISARHGDGSEFFRAEFETMQEAFPNTYAFPTSDTVALQNIEIVATKDGELSQSELETLAERRDVGVDLTDAVTRFTPPDDVKTSDVPVLTDDHAPVDALLQGQVGKEYVVVENGTETASA